MRSYRNAVLAVLFPAFVYAQPQPVEEPFTLVPPGISVRIEKFLGLEPAGLQQIRGLVSDRQGFLWCWTSEGIARFDGYETKVYREDLADTMGKYRTMLVALAIDGRGFVWGATLGAGLKRLDPSTGISRWYRGRDDDSNSIGTGATTLMATSDGELWAGGRFGLARYERRSDTFIRYGLPPGYDHPSDFPIVGLCESGRSIWMGLVNGGVAEFDREHSSWMTLRYDPTHGSGLSSDSVKSICADHQGNIWIGTASGLDRYDPRTDSWRRFSASRDEPGAPPAHPILAIVEDALEQIWVSVRGAGIFRFDPVTGRFTHYIHDKLDPNSLPRNTIASFEPHRLVDRSSVLTEKAGSRFSILWIPLYMLGVCRVIVHDDPCSTAMVRLAEGDELPIANTLWCDSPDVVWTGMANGLVGKFNLKTRMARWYAGPRQIWRMGRLRDGSLFLTGAGKAYQLDEKLDRFVWQTTNLTVPAFVEDEEGTLWLGCRRPTNNMTFLATLERKTGVWKVYPRDDPDSASHVDGPIIRMVDDRRGGIWYGTTGGGLIRFDKVRKTYKRYAGRPGIPGTLSANFVSAIVPDSGGRLWVGTHSGLNLMDCATGTFEHIRSYYPNSEPFIREMVDDGEGRLWIAAHSHILCFTKASRSFRTVRAADHMEFPGFWSVNFDPRSRTVTFGFAGGFFRFPIDSLSPEPARPPVVFTSFKVFEKDYPLERDVSALKSITLPYSASFFSFTFAALDYLDASKNQYAYRMEGVDPEWVFAGSRRYVSYTNLDPGRYLLRVKGSNSEGTWNKEGASIEIIVEPPWYRTAWAYGAYLVIGGSLLYLLYRFDRKRTALKQSLRMKSFEAEKMYEVDRMKSSFFANISHEFRTPLTLILGPLDQLMTRFRDEETRSTLTTMRRNGLRLLQLINQLLDLSKMDAGKMPIQVRPLDLVALARALVMSFTSLAEGKQIQLVFDPEEDEIIAYMDRDKIEKILTNLLSNAFKFTGHGGEVRVVLRMINGEGGRRAEIVVSDTGIGIEGEHLEKIFDRFYQAGSASMQDAGGTGIGLALVKELVELHNGKIDVQSSPGRGSTFTVRLPIGKECWRQDEIVTDEIIPDPEPVRLSKVVLDGEEPDDAAVGERTPGKPVVLLVEDNADVRTYIRGFLRECYDIIEAANGREALDKVHETEIDLVISDIMMPEMDGIALCRALKNDDKTSHMPVVLLTARATGEGKMEGLDSGADDYVTKPFDAPELMVRVKNLIEIRRRLRDRYEREVTLSPAQIQVTTAEERFLKKFVENVEKHIADAGYDTETLAHDLCMSRMQLNRKLHALTGHSTHELVREFRLQRAADLLHQHADNVSGVAFEVGFNSLSHFARAFRERFGVTPSEYEGSSADHKENMLHAK